MLKIKINKDIEEFSEGMFIGLNIRELGHLIALMAISIGMIFLLSRLMPFVFAVYLSLPVIIAFALMGRKIGNMSVKEFIRYMPVYKRLRRGVGFCSTEAPEACGIYEKTNEAAKADRRSQ